MLHRQMDSKTRKTLGALLADPVKLQQRVKKLRLEMEDARLTRRSE